MWEDYFSVQIFFIILRETLESAIIVSVLLSFLKQNFHTTDQYGNEVLTAEPRTYRKLQLQIWLGALAGLTICLVVGAIFVGAFYILGNDLWSVTERIWEGAFSIVSSLVISVMGLALLRINHLQRKWQWKLGRSLNNDRSEELLQETQPSFLSNISIYARRIAKEYALSALPFITTLREGLEAVVFIGGVGVNQPWTSFPLAILAGSVLGFMVGIFMYRGGNKLSLQFFLILSTCFLYMVASGLMSRGVWFLELERYVQKCNGQDMSEVGSGPGSYDIANSVWHVNCCNGLTDGGWMLLNALIGWTNSATYGSVFSYAAYWIIITIVLRVKLHEEKTGLLPFVPAKWQMKRVRKRIAVYEALATVNRPLST